MVRLEIDSNPPGAEVFRQGTSQRLGRTPFSIKQTPEPGYATFELVLGGYERELVSMPSDKSGASRATLRRIGRPSGARSASKKKGGAPVPDIKDTRRTTGPDDSSPPPETSPYD
jgi:hypothetical protein